MDNLNRILSWDITIVINYSLSRIKNYGNVLANILSHEITLSSEQLRFYFQTPYIDDIIGITSYLRLNNQNSCFLIDILIVLIMFGRGTIELKLNYLLNWFNVTGNGLLDEYEFSYLLVKVRFCLRKLGIKPLEYSQEDLRHVAFLARIQSDGNVLRGLALPDFVNWVMTSREGQTIVKLIRMFKSVNIMVQTTQRRLDFMLQIKDERSKSDFLRCNYLPSLPLHMMAVMNSKVVSDDIFITFKDQNTVNIIVRFDLIQNNEELYVKVSMLHELDEYGQEILHCSSKKKYYQFSSYLRFDVPRNYPSINYPVTISSLIPASVYEITAYTDTVRWPALRFVTSQLPSKTSTYFLCVLSPALSVSPSQSFDSSDNRLLKLFGSTVDRFIFTGSICPLNEQLPFWKDLVKQPIMQYSWPSVYSLVKSYFSMNFHHSIKKIFRMAPGKLSFLNGSGPWNRSHMQTKLIDNQLSDIECAYNHLVIPFLSRHSAWSEGPLKLLYLSLDNHRKEDLARWLSSLQLELLQPSCQVNTIIILARNLEDLLTIIPYTNPVSSSTAVVNEDAISNDEEEVVLTGKYELKYGAHSGRISRKTSSINKPFSFLTALLECLDSSISKISDDLSCSVITTDWLAGQNFDIVSNSYGKVVVRHESLLPTADMTQEMRHQSTILQALNREVSDDYQIRYRAASEHRSVRIHSRKHQRAKLEFIPLSMLTSNNARVESKLDKFIAFVSQPNILKITHSTVSLKIALSADGTNTSRHNRVLNCTVYRLPVYIIHSQISAILHSFRETLPLHYTKYIQIKRNTSPTLYFDGLLPNNSYCIYFHTSNSSPQYAYFQTMPHPSNFCQSVIFSSLFSQISSKHNSFLYPNSMFLFLESENRLPSMPVFLAHQTNVLPIVDTASLRPCPAIGAMVCKNATLSSDTARGVNVHVNGSVCFLSARAASAAGLVAIRDFIASRSQIETIKYIVIILPKPIMTHLRGSSIDGYAATHLTPCVDLLISCFASLQLSLGRDICILSLADIADCQLYRFSHSSSLFTITHVLLPRYQAASSLDSFPQGPCRLDSSLFYERVPLTSDDKVIHISVPRAHAYDSSTDSTHADSVVDAVQMTAGSVVSITYTVSMCIIPRTDECDGGITDPRADATAGSWYRMDIRGGASTLADIVQVIGPIIGRTTSTTAVILFEFSQDIAHLVCVVESALHRSEYAVDGVKAFTPVYVRFYDLLPGQLYSISLPLMSMHHAGLGSFQTCSSAPCFVDIAVVGNGTLEQNSAVKTVIRDYKLCGHFDIHRAIQILTTSYSDDACIPSCWTALLAQLSVPLLHQTVMYLGCQSLLLLRRDILDSLIELGSSTISELSACGSVVEGCQLQQLLDTIKDSFRLPLLAPGLSHALAKSSNSFLDLHSYRSMVADAVLDDASSSQYAHLQSAISEGVSSYFLQIDLPDIEDVESLATIAVHKEGALAKIQLLLPANPADFLGALQIQELKYVLQDVQLRQLVVYTESALVFTKLPPDGAARTQEAVDYDVDDVLGLLFQWMHQSTRLDVRGVALVCAGGIPFVSELVHSLTGARIYQFCVNNLYAPAALIVEAEQLVDLRGSLGVFEYEHFIGMEAVTVNGAANTSPLKVVKTQEVTPVVYRDGFATLRVWFDNTKATYDWRLTKNHHPSPSIQQPARLLVGPILGTFILSRETEAQQRAFYLPILFETDISTTIIIEMRQVFTSAISTFTLNTYQGTPTVLRVGPLELNSRYHCTFKSRIQFPRDFQFSFSTFYAENDSNYCFVNCRKPEGLQASYDFVLDLTARFALPFHGVTALVHLNAGLPISPLIARLSISTFKSELLACKQANSLSNNGKGLLISLVESVRQLLRDEFSQPSYRELLRTAFNVFVPCICELTLHADDDDLLGLLKLIVQSCQLLYFSLLTDAADADIIGAGAFDVGEFSTSIFTTWVSVGISPPAAQAVSMLWRAHNKMISLEHLDLGQEAAFEEVADGIANMSTDCRIRVLLIGNTGNHSRSQSVLSLLDANTSTGYKFQAALKLWLERNSARKVLLVSALETEGTVLKVLPIEDENIDPFALYVVDSLYRSNRYIHDSQLNEIEESFRSKRALNNKIGDTSVLSRRKQREDERLLQEAKQSRSNELWNSSPPDGFLLLECQYLDLRFFDPTMEYLLAFDVTIASGQELDNTAQHADHLQPPAWLPVYVPHKPGLFVIDEVSLLTRNSIDNKHVLAYIEDEQTVAAIKESYEQSRLFISTQAASLQLLQGEYLGLETNTNDFAEYIWNEIIPDNYKPLFAYFLDPFILSYTLGGVRFFLYLNSPEKIVECVQMALIYCLSIKMCMKMQKIRRWNSSLFTSNIRDDDGDLDKIDSFVDESDIADLAHEEAAVEAEAEANIEEQGVQVSPPVVERATLHFTDKKEEAKEMEVSRLERMNSEIERRRSERVSQLRDMGSKMNYFRLFRVSATSGEQV